MEQTIYNFVAIGVVVLVLVLMVLQFFARWLPWNRRRPERPDEPRGPEAIDEAIDRWDRQTSHIGLSFGVWPDSPGPDRPLRRGRPSTRLRHRRR